MFNGTQDPVQLQLGVALYCLGTYGNAASVQHVATKFGISEGSVVNFTSRIIFALRQASELWIKWPSKEERLMLGTEMALKKLPKCVGFVDGTDIILADAPTQNKDVYWSRKKKYCLQAQIICDHKKIIRDLFVGYPGSVHDAKVYMASPVGAHPETFFSPGEYIIGDSAYSLSETVIVPFRRKINGLTADKKSFNHHLSQHRVCVENTIGILKGRFQSLKGIRRRILNANNGHKKVCNWVHACAVLHNMLMTNDPWESEQQFEAEAHEDTTEYNNLNINQNKKGELKRLALLQIHKSI